MIYGNKYQIADFDTLCKFKLKTPASAGKLWEGIPHRAMAQAVEAEALSLGYTTPEARYHIWRNGADVVAAWHVVGSGLPGKPSALGWWLGLAYSNARRRAPCVYAGLAGKAGCYPCSAWPLDVKFVPSTSLKGLATDILAVWAGALPALAEAVSVLQATPIKKLPAEHLQIIACRRKLVAWSRLGYADLAWRKRCEEGQQNLLALGRVFASVTRRNTPRTQLDQLAGLHQLLMGRVAREGVT